MFYISGFSNKFFDITGIQKHIIHAAVGAAAGRYIDTHADDYVSEKDAVLRHYIQLHPEDFPMPGLSSIFD